MLLCLFASLDELLFDIATPRTASRVGPNYIQLLRGRVVRLAVGQVAACEPKDLGVPD